MLSNYVQSCSRQQILTHSPKQFEPLDDVVVLHYYAFRVVQIGGKGIRLFKKIIIHGVTRRNTKVKVNLYFCVSSVDNLIFGLTLIGIADTIET